MDAGHGMRFTGRTLIVARNQNGQDEVKERLDKELNEYWIQGGYKDHSNLVTKA